LSEPLPSLLTWLTISMEQPSAQICRIFRRTGYPGNYGAGQVVGIAGLSWHDDYWPDDGQAGYVFRMAVRDAWHGRGLGREILAWASKTAQSRGCSLLRLDCLASNRRLCRYYQRQRFERRAEIVDRDYRAALYEKQLEGCGAWRDVCR
jgi:GNAT superfamily N-acetyltransferase